MTDISFSLNFFLEVELFYFEYFYREYFLMSMYLLRYYTFNMFFYYRVIFSTEFNEFKKISIINLI